MHHTRVSLYLKDLLQLTAPRSTIGQQLELLQNGIVPTATLKNTIEDHLLRLVDRFPDVPMLTLNELRILLVYYHAIGGKFETLGNGGAILDQWASGVDHKRAAKLLGIGGRNPAVTARKKLIRIQKKIWNPRKTH